MKTVIAEKPSVAREIAQLLGADQKNDGYMEGEGFYVTWAIGHLVALAMPQDYGIIGFQKEQLPIIPDQFLLTVRKVKKGKMYIDDSAAVKQLKIIDKLFKSSDSIIVATDAGREGELIFRYIYDYLNCSKPFERLWISSLTERAIRSGFENLKSGSDFDGLYYAARCRSEADWLVGINSSQALSISAGNEVYSLGRVQTPTLKIICDRYIENKRYEVKKYWQIELQHTKNSQPFTSRSKIIFESEADAKDALTSVLRKNEAEVQNISSKTVKENPPLLFDLTGLQKEANKRWRISAEQTLNIAQSLYEKKFITYPRTGSRYIPEDLWPEIPILVRELGKKESFFSLVEKMKFARYNKHIVNDLKVTDHHGILITDKIPSYLSAEENKIYEMVASRFLESISSICIKEITDVQLRILHFEFEIKGSKILEEGWRFIRKLASDDNNEELQELPFLNEGDKLEIRRSEVKEKHTKAPPLHTEASLLSAMEQAGRAMEDKEQQKVLRDIGIGTPATRASIIETLFRRNYIVRDRKHVVPTEKGLKVHEWIKDQNIADVSMTADWELKLSDIENHCNKAEVFSKSIQDFTCLITKELLSLCNNTDSKNTLSCPKCKTSKITIKDKLFECSSTNCDWKQWRNICGIQLSVKDLELLISTGKTSLLKGMKGKAHKVFDAYLVLKANFETSFEFPQKKAKRK